MNQNSLATRLGEYISLILPDAHGHQQKAICDFVFALLSVRTCCQAELARFFENFEAASKRLFRLLHDEMRAGMNGWQRRDLQRIEDAENIELSLLREVRRIGEEREGHLHHPNIDGLHT